MNYELILMPEAERHLKEWIKSGQKKTLRKIVALFEELRQHPNSGTGELQGFWSRRIDKGSRLVYKIDEDIVTVFVISMKGHYGDK